MGKNYLRSLYIFTLLGPIIDLATSFMVRFTNTPYTVGVILRGAFLLILCMFILFLNKSKYKVISKVFLILLGIFSVVYLSNKVEILKEITYLFKFMYFPITLVSLLSINDEYKINNSIFSKIIQINVIVTCVLILLAFITNTSFSSYAYEELGCIGWFYSANEIGTILAIAFPYLFYILKRYKSFKSLFVILPIVFTMALIGTKTPFLGLFFASIIFGIYFFIKRKIYTIKPFITILITIFFVVLLSPSLPVMDNVKNTLNLEGNPVAPLSNRDVFLDNIKKIQSEEGTYELLMGVGFTNTDKITDKNVNKLIEMDVFEIYFRYGILGSILYFFPLIIVLFYIIKYVIISKFKLNYELLIYGFSASISLFISFFAGHVMSSPGVSLYVSITLVMLIKEMYYKDKLVNKVTMYTLSLGYGGIEKFMSSLSKMLDDDYEIEIVSTYKKIKEPAFEFSDKVKITYLINRSPNKEEVLIAFKKRKIFSLIKECFIASWILFKKNILSIDNIMNNNSKYIITTKFHSYAVGEYALKSTIKIATEHDYHNNEKRYINKIVSSVLHFDYLVVVSKELENFYKDKIGKTKCVYIPNVIDKLPIEKSKLDNFNIINVGRFVYEKGLYDLIDIFENVNKVYNESKLYLIGDGYLKKDLIRYVKSKHLENNVIFTGFLKPSETKQYYLKSSLYVMTSYTESFGLTLVESASYGVPAVAFNTISGAREILKDTGVLIKYRNSEKMSQAIIDLFNHKKLLKDLSNKSYKNVKQYLLENVKPHWLKLLKQEKGDYEE